MTRNRRHGHVPRVLGCLVAAGGLLAACSSSGSQTIQGEVSASCVGPTLAITPHVAGAGATVRADGKWFAADCYDTGQPGSPPALTAMKVQVSQSGQVWTVATGIDAGGDDYSFHVPLQLPEGLHPGSATVEVAGYGRPTKVLIRAATAG
jgi:hypothetical protein